MSFSEWKSYKLGEITSKIGSGATPKGGKDSYMDEGEYSLIRSQNVLDFSFSYAGLAFINEVQARKLNNVVLEENDVLLNITGDSVARVCQVPKNVLPARVNQHVAIIRPNQKILESAFLKYYLLNPTIKSILLNYSSVGATRNAITKSMIEDFEVVIPEVNTQQKIASVLSSLDDKIELNRQTNQTLEAIAQALFQEMCVPKGDELPEGWSVGKLGDEIETVSETYKLGNKENIIFLNTGDILNGLFLHSNYSMVSTLPGQAKKRIRKNDILFSEIRPINRRFAFVNFEADEYVVSTKLMVLRTKRLNPIFLYFYLTRQEMINNLQHLAETRSGTFPQITFSQLEDLKIILPPTKILNEFIRTLEANFYLQKKNEQECQTFSTLRDSLLPKLMKGEIEI